jgi:hypothetical protein
MATGYANAARYVARALFIDVNKFLQTLKINFSL